MILMPKKILKLAQWPFANGTGSTAGYGMNTYGGVRIMPAHNKVLFFVVPVIIWGVLFGVGCKKKEDIEKAKKEPVTSIGPSMDESALLGKQQISPHMEKQFPKEMLEALQKSRHEADDSSRLKKRDMPVTVPPDVQGKWKAVVIEVANKQTNKQKDYVIHIDKDFIIPDTRIRIKVLAFLPDFSMSPNGITSLSNEPRNPAARVVIYEEGKEIFEGWLFKKRPMVHPFEHKVYAIRLDDFVENHHSDGQESARS
jgi:hypothetical protein